MVYYINIKNYIIYIMTENPKLKMYYFYSCSYLFFHEHIQERLSNYMDLKPILINDIPEIPNQHHFTGLTIKLELVIDAIQKNLGETIIFSDATIFIHSENGAKLEEYINQFHAYDICFIDESMNERYNIGFLTIKCSEKTMNFFKEALNLMQIINHDQAAVNYLLQTTELNYIMYDHRIFCGDFREELRDSFIIYKSFISNKNKTENFNQRIQNFYDNRFINTETYDKWYKIENNV